MPFGFPHAHSTEEIDSYCKDEASSLLNSVSQDGPPYHVDSPVAPQSTTYGILAIMLCVGCVAFNWFITITYPAGSKGTLDVRSISRNQYKTLRRPPPFIGFESISRATPPIPRELLNYPMITTMVNASDPGQVFDNDPLQHMTSTGTVSPDARRVLLTKEISTVVQFRALDYKMERCELHIKMTEADTAGLPHGESIAVYRLASNLPIDAKTLSYATKPVRTATVGSISISPGSCVDWHHDFRCIWDSLSVFEVARLGQGHSDNDGEDFRIQWWQDKDQTHPPKAIYVIQRESS